MNVFTVFLLLFVQCGFVNTLTVIQIYVCCNELYAHCFPQESTTLGSAAQSGNGEISVRPPVFDLVVYPRNYVTVQFLYFQFKIKICGNSS